MKVADVPVTVTVLRAPDQREVALMAATIAAGVIAGDVRGEVDLAKLPLRALHVARGIADELAASPGACRCELCAAPKDRAKP